MEIHQIISKEQYREIQKFCFYKKHNQYIFYILTGLFLIAMGVVNIVTEKNVSVGAIVFIMIPFIIFPLTNIRINDVVSKLYEKDIREWYITINKDMIEAKLDNKKQGLKLPSKMWLKAYELNSIILVYFNSNQFISISKKELSKEQLMEVKGILYDTLGRKFHLKKAK